MMLKKMMITLTALMSFTLVLTACQTAPQNGNKETVESAEETPKVYKDMTEFAKAVKDANEKITSVHMDTNLEFYNQKVAPYQTVEMVTDAVYQDQKISRINTLIESKTEGRTTGKEGIIIPNASEVYVKSSETEDYQVQTLTEEQLDAFNLNPDYFELLNHLYENADALSVENKGNEYIVTIKDADLSLIETFGKEFNFHAEGFSENEGEKELTIIFDSKTLYMKHLHASLTFDKSPIYLQIASNNDFSKWNEIKEGDIKAP